MRSDRVLITSWDDTTDACFALADLAAAQGLLDLDWELLLDGFAAAIEKYRGHPFDRWAFPRSMHRLQSQQEFSA